MSSRFILHFKLFLGHLIIPRIKLFSFNREAINHFKIYFSTLSEKNIFLISIVLLNKKLKPEKTGI